MPKFKDIGDAGMMETASPSEHKKYYPSFNLPKDALPWINKQEVGAEFQVLIKVKKTGEFEDNKGVESRLEIRSVYVTKEETDYLKEED